MNIAIAQGSTSTTFIPAAFLRPSLSLLMKIQVKNKLVPWSCPCGLGLWVP